MPDIDTVGETPTTGVDTFDFSAMNAAIDFNYGTFADTGVGGNSDVVNAQLTIQRVTQNADAMMIERIVGTPFADTIRGSSFNAVILEGGPGVDLLHGGTRGDTYVVNGNDQIREAFVGLSTKSQIQYSAGTHNIDFLFEYQPSSFLTFTANRTFPSPASVDLFYEVLDAMFAGIGANQSQWDIDVDGSVNFDDAIAFVENVLGTYFGDANLDGQVDRIDLNVVGSKWQMVVAYWQSGDFNGDDFVNALDLNLLGQNWQNGV